MCIYVFGQKKFMEGKMGIIDKTLARDKVLG